MVRGTPPTLEERVDRAGRAVAPLLAGLVALGVTRSTMLPGLGFWDTGEFQAVAPTLGTAHPTGYPAFILLGWLASIVLGPVGEPAARMNALSGVLLAVAAGLTVVAVRQVAGRTLPALAAGVLLAVTPIPWQVGSFADPHMLHLALVAGILVLLLAWEQRRVAGDGTARDGIAGEQAADRWLVAAAGLYGVSLANHQLTLLLAPGIALLLLSVDRGILRRRRLVARCLVAMLGVAGLLYLELPLRASMGAPIVYGHPDTPIGFLFVVLGVQFAGDVAGPASDITAKGGELVGLVVRQFGVLAAALPVAFAVVALRRPRVALLTGTWAGVTVAFATVYHNAMIERYYLVPILCAVVWLGSATALAVDAVQARRLRASGNAAPAAFATADVGGAGGAGGAGGVAGAGLASGAPAGAGVASGAGGAPGTGATGGNAGGMPSLPVTATRGAASAQGRDWFAVRLAFVASAILLVPAVWAAPTTFAAVDQHADVSAGQWSRWALSTVDRDAVLLTWWSFSTPLWYRQAVLGERPDVAIVDDRDREDQGLGSVDDVIRANLATRPVYLVRLGNDLASLATRWQLVEVADPNGRQSLFRVAGPATGTR